MCETTAIFVLHVCLTHDLHSHAFVQHEETPLMAAVSANALEIVKTLINNKANVAAKNEVRPSLLLRGSSTFYAVCCVFFCSWVEAIRLGWLDTFSLPNPSTQFDHTL